MNLIRFKRGLESAIRRFGLIYGEPGLVLDNPTRPKLLVGDRGGVPRRLTVAVEDVDGLTLVQGPKGDPGEPGPTGPPGPEGRPGKDGVAESASGGDIRLFNPMIPHNPGSPLNDEFTGASLDPRWIRVNWDAPGHASAVDTATDRLTSALSGAAGDPHRCLLQPIAGGDFTVWTRLRSDLPGQYTYTGLILSDGATPGAGNQYLGFLTAIHGLIARPLSGFQNNPGGVVISAIAGNSIFLRFRRSGSSYFLGWSYDGDTWSERAVAPGFTPTHAGLEVWSDLPTVQHAQFEFFRYAPTATATLGGHYYVSSTPSTPAIPV